MVEEIFGRVARNDPITVIVADLNRRGVLAPAGESWHRNTIRKIVFNVAYLGQRSHKGEVHDGTWPELVNAEIFHAAGKVLADPKRKTSQPGRLKHLLSYVASTPRGSVVHYMGPQRGVRLRAADVLRGVGHSGLPARYGFTDPADLATDFAEHLPYLVHLRRHTGQPTRHQGAGDRFGALAGGGCAGLRMVDGLANCHQTGTDLVKAGHMLGSLPASACTPGSSVGVNLSRPWAGRDRTPDIPGAQRPASLETASAPGRRNLVAAEFQQRIVPTLGGPLHQWASRSFTGAGPAPLGGYPTTVAISAAMQKAEPVSCSS